MLPTTVGSDNQNCYGSEGTFYVQHALTNDHEARGVHSVMDKRQRKTKNFAVLLESILGVGVAAMKLRADWIFGHLITPLECI